MALLPSVARGHVPAETIERAPIRWTQDEIPLIVRHAAEDVTPSQSAAAVSAALNAWNAVSPLRIRVASGGANTLSYSTDERLFGPGVVAVTSLSYAGSSGKVRAGKISLNQTAGRGFCFSADKAGASCGTGVGWGLNRFYVGDVVAHELGHFQGLAHSEVRGSTMVYVATRGQHSPHADDASGIRAAYGLSGWGNIRGKVRGGGQVPVFGAHVQAISASTGGVAGAAVSAEDGSFRVGGLPPDDTYYLYVEPLRKISAMPDAFLSVQNDFCPGTWAGSFFETCGNEGKGRPQPLRLTPSTASVDVGVVSVRCHLRLGEAYLSGKAAAQGGTYDFTATSAQPMRAFVGLYPSTTLLPTTFASSTGQDDEINLDLSSLPVPSGNPRLEMRLTTAAIGSPLDLSVEIDGPSGTLVDPDRVLAGGYGVTSLEADTLRPILERRLLYPLDPNPSLNVFSIRLKPRALRGDEVAAAFPADSSFVLTDRPWLASVSVVHDNGSGDHYYYQDTAPILADNRDCLDAPFTHSVRANTVPASAMAGESEDSAKVGEAAPTCGSLGPPSGPGGQGPGWGVAVLGFVLMLRLPRRRLS